MTLRFYTRTNMQFWNLHLLTYFLTQVHHPRSLSERKSRASAQTHRKMNLKALPRTCARQRACNNPTTEIPIETEGTLQTTCVNWRASTRSATLSLVAAPGRPAVTLVPAVWSGPESLGGFIITDAVASPPDAAV